MPIHEVSGSLLSSSPLLDWLMCLCFTPLNTSFCSFLTALGILSLTKKEGLFPKHREQRKELQQRNILLYFICFKGCNRPETGNLWLSRCCPTSPRQHTRQHIESGVIIGNHSPTTSRRSEVPSPCKTQLLEESTRKKCLAGWDVIIKCCRNFN